MKESETPVKKPVSRYVLKRFTLPNSLLAVFIIEIIILLTGGFLLDRYLENYTQQKVYKELQTISRLKVQQIQTWRSERRADAQVLTDSIFFTEEMVKLIREKDSRSKKYVFAQIESLMKNYRYSHVLITGTDGNFLFCDNDECPRQHPFRPEAVQNAFATRTAFITDIHKHENENGKFMGFVAPMFDGMSLDAKPLGTIILVNKVDDFLYPLIRTWPVPSESAESLIVRRRGDHVLYLNDLRHQRDTALELKMPLTETRIPAVMAVLGHEGVIEGKDYRGVEVISSILPIPDSPWFLISKIDEDEAFHDSRLLGRLIIIFAILLTMTAIAVTLLVWLRADTQRRAAAYTRSLIEANLDPLIAIGPDGKVTDVNSATEKVTGYSRVEIIGTDFAEYFTEPDKARLGYEKAFKEGFVHDYPLEIKHREGKLTPVLYNASIYKDEKGKIVGVFAAARDITELMKAEDSLRQSEARFRDLVNLLPVHVFETDLQGIVTFANKNVADTIGYDQSDIEKGLLLYSTIVPEQRDRARENTRRRFLGEKVGGIEYTVLRKDGGTFEVISFADPIIRDGRTVGLRGVSLDITGLKKAKEELTRYRDQLEVLVSERTSELRQARERLQFIMSSMPAMIYSNRAYGNFAITFITENVAQILGYTVETLLDNPDFWMENVHPDDLPKVAENLKTAYEKGRFIHEYRFRHKNGEYRWLLNEVKVIYDSDGRPREMIGYLADVTERKKAEDALRERSLELERSNADLEQFAYVTSHDLQEPLRAVSSFAQLLDERYRDIFDENGRVFINFITDGALRMHQMINDLLEYSRIGTRGAIFGQINMKKAVNRALENLSVAISESHAVINVGQLPPAIADEGQMVQLFQNLVGNAIKFSKGKVPEINIRAENVGDELVYSVSDNGIGIDPKYFKRIFTIFQRLHTREEYPGTGIGLALCKKIIERHGGRIWIESQPGKGTTFFFTISGKINK